MPRLSPSRTKARLAVQRVQWRYEDEQRGWGTYSRWHQAKTSRQANTRFEFVMLAALLSLAVCFELATVGVRLG